MGIIPSIRSLLFVLVMLAISAAVFSQIGISVSFGPPALPVYEQPPVPAEGYLWTPGYWAYGDGDYYWVPGTWVMAPQVGYLWTPGYWGWRNGGYAFNEGYWGPHVGFYGGINYGYGYGGQGYEGGRWNNRQFEYNRSVNNVNVINIHNTYNTTVINNTTLNRVSYNGGNGGITAAATAQDQAAAREKHIAPVAVQTQHEQAARANPQQRASVNQGKPAIAATPKPGAFSAGVPAKQAGAPYNAAAANRSAAKPSPSTPAARLANNVSRPGAAERSTPAARNNVHRPPSALEKASAPRPENPPRTAENASRNESTPRSENALHQEASPRAETASRPENAPHPQAATREAAPRPANAPHAETEARPQAAARPQAEPHPEDKEARPEEHRQQ